MDKIFTHIATRIANASGQPITFIVALLLIVVWAATGPAFHYSDTWQLIVNTSTTIVTFLMVFLIQNSQNRDASAMQAKLDELIRSVDKAREQFIGIEHLTDLEICEIRDALEKEVSDAEDKQRTADDTVDRLLKRHYRIRRREMRKANAG
ncbi:low affinity iron permease family protein [Sphingomonas sp.]|uniref:low affinity iron permease family protein n=1 Tax=Sphingomonas sp. TaxID=28214 RepID=UPI002DBD268A|nr:low affinity iron permease family protein [Sphingomonas sp.]HEU4967641.1 low affinity iron permease family protein [Sphingomonas sp.]